MEDMCSATFSRKNYLYFADIGDNGAVHPSVKIVRVSEPVNTKTGSTKPEIYTLTYPNGAQNSEAFFVQPGTGTFWLIEKTSAHPSRIYRCVNPRVGSNVWELMGEISLGGSLAPTKLVTGASVSRDGRYVVVRTYTAAYEYAVGSNFNQWFSVAPTQITTNAEIQGEAICYSTDGMTLLTSSEGSPCPISKISVSGQR
jgi:hypothetical protein